MATALGAAVTTAVATASATAVAQTTAAPGATIHPGVMMYTNGAQCTANFIFTDGSATYIGQAAHCSGTGSDTDTNGCTSKSLPLNTPVMIEGASRPGTMVYNSWLAMQGGGPKDPNACAHNDLALVRIDPADASKVSPSVPFFGGPKGIDVAGTQPGEQVHSYGNSKLRSGVSALSPKVGVSLGDEDGGWTHTVATMTPGIPGDSGSAFLTSDGRALGVLSTLNLLPGPGTNGVSDINKMLAYAQANGKAGLQIVNG